MAISVFATSPTRAQDAAQDQSRVTVTAADQAAADEATVTYRHARPANTPAGATLKQKDITPRREVSKTTTSATSTTDNDQLRYPADLSDFFGGAVVEMAQSHAVYLLPKNGSCNRITPCWGNPEGFLFDLSGTDFIHLVDQYVGMAASNRYTLGARATISYTPTPKTKPLQDADMQAIVHAVALKTGLSG